MRVRSRIERFRISGAPKQHGECSFMTLLEHDDHGIGSRDKMNKNWFSH